MKAVIPAVGFGTSFLPATKAQPKEMLPVYDKPAIQYVIEEAIASGIGDILIVTGRNKRSVEDHFDKSYELEYTLQKAGRGRVLKDVRKITDLADISYVRQKKQRGLGDAVKCAEMYVGDEPFAVLLGDTITKGPMPCTKNLIDVHNKYGSSVVSIKDVPKDKVECYDIVKANNIEDNVYKINQLIEKPQLSNAPSNFAIMGRYILMPEIFDMIYETDVGVNNEIQLTDALSKLDSIFGVNFKGKTFNMENRLEWLKTSIQFAIEDVEFREDLLNYMKTFI